MSTPEAADQTGALNPTRAAPGCSTEDPLQLDGSSGRRGVRSVPPSIRIDQQSRWLSLDFQLADREPGGAEVIDVELLGGAGWVLLVLPPQGRAVDVARLSVGWGSPAIEVDCEPAPGAPLLTVHGTDGVGQLRIRHPGPCDRRRAARYLRHHPQLRQPEDG